jgi:hypothetical protein
MVGSDYVALWIGNEVVLKEHAGWVGSYAISSEFHLADF